MSSYRILVLVSILSLCGCAGAAAPPVHSSAAASEQWWPSLRDGLVGAWTLTGEGGRELEVVYRVTSRGSALLETWAPGAAGETLTVYHPDGEALLLTHYCGQGNQATLRAVEASEGRVLFRRIAVTNYDDVQSALYELTLELSDEGQLVRTEAYTAADGERETTVLRFARRAADAVAQGETS